MTGSVDGNEILVSVQPWLESVRDGDGGLGGNGLQRGEVGGGEAGNGRVWGNRDRNWGVNDT